MADDGKALEIEIAQGDSNQEKINNSRVEGSCSISFWPDDEAAEDEKEYSNEDEKGEDIDKKRKKEAEIRVAEDVKIIKEAFERVVNSYRIESEGAVKNEDMHEPSENSLVLQSALLEEDLSQCLLDPLPHRV